MTMNSMNIKYQLVPPSNHREKNAERTIQSFKIHLIVVLCSIDKDFNLQLWGILLKQAKIILNMIRQSRTLTHLSVYTHIFGEFYFNRTPLAPHRTQVVIHNRPNDRASWIPHGEDGWYIGPSMECYRCHKSYIPKTRVERISETVDFFPKTIQHAKDLFQRCNFSCRTGFNLCAT